MLSVFFLFVYTYDVMNLRYDDKNVMFNVGMVSLKATIGKLNNLKCPLQHKQFVYHILQPHVRMMDDGAGQDHVKTACIMRWMDLHHLVNVTVISKSIRSAMLNVNVR